MTERETTINGTMKILYKCKLTIVGESSDTCDHKHDLKRPVWAFKGVVIQKISSYILIK